MGRNGVALLASWDNPSVEEGGWGCRGGGAALLPSPILSGSPRNLGAASAGLGDLTRAPGLGAMAKVEKRWAPRTGSPTAFKFSGWGWEVSRVQGKLLA